MSVEVLENIIVEKVDAIEYYNKMILPLDKKFRPMTVGTPTSLCPFHHDTDPSLRVWRGKSGKGTQIFHCFGCGAGGNVVFIHMRIMNQYHKKRLTKEEAITQLAKMFNITLPSFEELPVQENIFQKMRSKLLASDNVPKGKLTLAEYRKTNNRIKGYDIYPKQKANAFNKLDITMAVEMINSKM